MPRKGWKAAPMKNPETNQNLTKPVKIAAIFHTGILTDRCDMTTDCCNQVKYIQEFQMKGGMECDKILFSIFIYDVVDSNLQSNKEDGCQHS